ncbi:MAG: YibE/F family protein [Frankiales bacterium]|nr:YibE/F family protein [Frankiales bacterium]
MGLVLALAPFVVATVAGIVSLWPHSHHFHTPPEFQTAAGVDVTYPHATVSSIVATGCQGNPSPGTSAACAVAHFRLTSGAGRGSDAAVLLTPGAGEPALHVGDHVILARTADEQGRPAYYFEDFARGLPLVALAAVFAVLAIAVGRLRGFAALLGLGVAFTALVEFVLPALLSGRNPALVALTAGSAVMIVVLYLGHGVSARTTVAVLGTLCGLGLVGAIGLAAVGGTHLTGLSSDDLTAVQAAAPHVDVTGILLAGLVIGSLGVLNDVTVTQASAVWELHAANPVLGPRRLYAAAMRIGRDHIASTIYTLLLAYAGAALPVLMLFTLSNQPLGVLAGSDLAASDIVRSLCGAIGLLLAVPLTTVIAVAAVTHTRKP